MLFRLYLGIKHSRLERTFCNRDPMRVLREIEALNACNHANISRLLDVQMVAYGSLQAVYFIEEFLNGGTLSSRIDGWNRIAIEDGITLGRSLTDAIAHLWSLKLVHRDIKPDNIMFRSDGTAVLLDLGIARHLSAESLTRTMTPRSLLREWILDRRTKIG